MPSALQRFVDPPSEVELLPEPRMTQQSSGIIRPDDPNKKCRMSFRSEFVLELLTEGTDAAALDQRPIR
jgi:hypothetical protein